MVWNENFGKEDVFERKWLVLCMWSCSENSSLHQFPVTHTSANLLSGSAVQLCLCGISGLLTCPGDGHSCGHSPLAQRITEDFLN